jgi:hypothetical protein
VGAKTAASIYPLSYPDSSWHRPATVKGYSAFITIGKAFPGTSSDTIYVAAALTGRQPQGGEVLTDAPWNDPTRYACKVLP